MMETLQQIKTVTGGNRLNANMPDLCIDHELQREKVQSQVCDNENSQLISETKLNVSSTNGLVRKTSLKLISRSPRPIKKNNAMQDMDRSKVLSQCEELTTWVNTLLKQQGLSLQSDLKRSMSDGTTFPQLVEILCSDFRSKPELTSSQQGKFEQIRVGLEHLNSIGFTCSQVTTQDIVNGDLKSVILLLSSLRTFSEQKLCSSNFDNTQWEAHKDSNDSGPVAVHKLSTREQMESQKTGVSISERLKWLLKDDVKTAINVDSGERETINRARETPLGESDSAVSPHSNSDSYKNVSSKSTYKESSKFGNTNQNGCYDKQFSASTLQSNKQSSEYPVINKSVPNLYSQSLRSNQSQSCPSTPNSKLKLSVHPSGRPVSYQSNLVSENQSVGATDYSSRPLMYQSVNPSNQPRQMGLPQPEINQQHRTASYSVTRSPYSGRRQLHAQPNHYETITPVNNYRNDCSDGRRYKEIEEGSEAVNDINYPQTNQNTVPQDMISASDVQLRRSSVPALRYSGRLTKKGSNTDENSTDAALNSHVFEGNDDDENDYVDIDNNSEVEDSRADTPPLPGFLGDNTDEESSTSDPQATPMYKYSRSASASAKLSSAEVSSLQRKLQQSSRLEDSIQEQPDIEKKKSVADHGQGEHKRIVKPMRVSNTATRLVNEKSEWGEDKLNEESRSRTVTPKPTPHPRSSFHKQTDRQTNKEHTTDSRSRRHTKDHPLTSDQHKSIDEKFRHLEYLYEDIANYIRASRQTRASRRRNSITSVSSSQISHRHKRTSQHADLKAIQKRFQRIESHIVTLAKSVAHLSSEVKFQQSVVSEYDRLNNDMQLVKQHFNQNNPISQKLSPEDYTDVKTEPHHTPQKISKLTRLKSAFKERFFGQEPPLMKIFLKQLGYEKYLAVFESEKIGLVELPYITDDKLRQLGIPMGPRVRILQEASRLNTKIYHNSDSNTLINRYHNI